MKVTGWLAVPTAGAVEGVVNAKVPGTLATPPLKIDAARVCPTVIAVAVGAVVMVGVVGVTVPPTVRVPSPVMRPDGSEEL